MYALIDIKGKQYKAEKGARLKVDHLAQAAGESIEFESVLMTSNEGEVKVGTPYVKDAKVTAVVEAEGRDKKLIVFKYKKRKGYRKTQGHRQAYSVLKVEDIIGAYGRPNSKRKRHGT